VRRNQRRHEEMRFKRTKSEMGVIIMAICTLACMGCSSGAKERRGEPMHGKATGIGRYYFFDDVFVPKELSYESDESFVYETPEAKTGTMVFKKWRADSRLLVNFFLYNMEKDDWTLLNNFSGKETVLNFTKPDKTCTIRIVDTWYGTIIVEVQVGPVGTKRQ
jgi:hypothetical protein